MKTYNIVTTKNEEKQNIINFIKKITKIKKIYKLIKKKIF